MKLKIIKDLKIITAFLTRIPVKIDIDDYEEIARKMWLFPFIGWLIGIISGLIGLLFFQFVPDLIVGFLILGVLLYLTGVHHVDGLFDFGDGLMAHGSPEKKIKIMHDVAIGAGGMALGFIILSLTGISISFLNHRLIIYLITAEVGAKFAMVFVCSFGKSVQTKMAEPFLRLNKFKHAILSYFLSIILISSSALLLKILNDIIVLQINPDMIAGLEGFSYLEIPIIIIIFSVITPLSGLMMNFISKKHFNGITGDCLGALNEITRMLLLLAFVVVENLSIF